MFGILTTSAFVHGPVETFGQVVVVGGALSAACCSSPSPSAGSGSGPSGSRALDAKKIGIMYLVLASSCCCAAASTRS
jgi:hypothetical protein